MEVREVREARPVTMETISSSWVTEVWGNGGMEPQAGVRASGLETCSQEEEEEVEQEVEQEHNRQIVSVSQGMVRSHETWSKHTAVQ